MRFAQALSLLPLLAYSAIASPILSDTSLTRVYRRAVSADICATVDVTVPITGRVCTLDADGTPVDPLGLDLAALTLLGITCVDGNQEILTLAPDVCLCLDGGALTTDSIANLALSVNALSRPVLTLLNPFGGNPPLFLNLGALLDSLQDALEVDIGDRTTSCIYPPEGTPSGCGDDCPFTCPINSRPCGRNCIPFTETCVSGVNFRRRDQLSLSPDDRCPGVLSACAIPTAQFFNGRNYECIDTTSDLESCGACAFPLPGQPFGQDCTAIPHALSVDCVNGGCVVKACERGFEIREGNTTCVPLTIEENFERWQKEKDAVAKRQVNADKLRSRVYKSGV